MLWEGKKQKDWLELLRHISFSLSLFQRCVLSVKVCVCMCVYFYF